MVGYFVGLSVKLMYRLPVAYVELGLANSLLSIFETWCISIVVTDA